MSGPQIEDGFTRIANELLDAIVRANFSKREYKVVLAVIRATYGYNKKSETISTWWLAKMTGLKRSHASETAATLVERNILLRSEGERRHGQEVSGLGVNKKYNEWTGPKTDPVQNGTGPETGQVTGPKTGTEPAPKRETYKDSKDKKTNIAQSLMERFEKFYSAYPRKVGKKHAMKAFVSLNPDEALLSLMLSAIEKQKQARATKERRGIWVPEWKHPATWINGGCWDDEVEDVKPKPRRVVV